MCVRELCAPSLLPSPPPSVSCPVLCALAPCGRVQVYLAGLGNLGLPHHVAIVHPLTRHPHFAVAAAAVRALRRMAPAVSSPVLRQLLEPHPVHFRALMGGLRSHGQRGSSGAGTATQRVSAVQRQALTTERVACRHARAQQPPCMGAAGTLARRALPHQMVCFQAPRFCLLLPVD
jgi:hypothetical protein